MMSLELSGGATPTTSLGRPIDPSKIAYQLPQPMGMVADALIAGALALDGDEQEWVPQAQGVWFKPLLLNVSHGYYINILRVRALGVLSRHRHHGPVHAFTLRGTWRYLEHDWWRRPATMRSSRRERRTRSSSRTMLGG
jgi:2,4'-dihydroxyacetophenone dioxygenase